MTAETSGSMRPRLTEAAAVGLAGSVAIIDCIGTRLTFDTALPPEAARGFFGRLNGDLPLETLAADLGIAVGHADAIVSALAGEGLIAWTDGSRPDSDDSEDPAIPAAVRRFSEYLTAGPGDGNADGGVLPALARSTAIIVAPGEYFDALAGDLTQCGVLDLRHALDLKSALEAGRGIPADRPGVIVYFDDPADRGSLEEILGLGRLLGWPVLTFWAGAGRLRVGPVWSAQDPLCVDCYRTGLADQPAAAEDVADPAASDGSMDSLSQATVALVGAQAFELLSGLRQPSPVARVTMADIDALSLLTYILTPEDDCPTCYGSGQERRPAARVDRFEYLCGLSSSAMGGLSVGESANDYVSLALERRAFRGYSTLTLPTAGPGRASYTDETKGRLERLAHAVVRTAGYRQPPGDTDGPPRTHRRWTANGGNLASVELYTVAPNLAEPGSFAVAKYDDLRHALVLLNASESRIRDVASLCGIDELTADDRLIVLVSASWRLGLKYGEFARRLAHLDAGCAAVQLAVSSLTVGYEVAYLPSWPEELAELLRLRPMQEQIVALARLRDLVPTTSPLSAEETQP